MADDDLVAFARLVDALRPWLEHLVIVGGWAHRLHRMHDWAAKLQYPPLLTKDADVAIPRAEKLAGDMRAALTASGFEEILVGEHRPPVAEYRLTDTDDAFFAEFLVPLIGSGMKRSGATDATMIAGGVSAQKLRHLDVLFALPWIVRLDAERLPIETPADIRIANPVSFIAQKLLIREERAPSKRAQDVLYVHDTLELFGGRLDDLRAAWRNDIRPVLLPKTALDIERLRREVFGEVDDVLRNASRIPADRSLSPERLREDCEYGLEAIFGVSNR